METSQKQEIVESYRENIPQTDPTGPANVTTESRDSRGVASAYMDVVMLLRILLVNSWLIILVTGIGAAGAFLYTEIQTPIYETSSTLIVLPFGDPSRDEIDAIRALNLNIIGNYVQLLRSRSITEAAYAELTDEYSLGALRDAVVDIRPISNSSIINVSVRSSDPQLAKDLVDQIALTIQTSNDESIISFVDAYPIEVLDVSEVPTTPVTPQRRLAVVFGAAGALAVGVVLAFLLDGFTHYRRSLKKRNEPEAAPESAL